MNESNAEKQPAREGVSQREKPLAGFISGDVEGNHPANHGDGDDRNGGYQFEGQQGHRVFPKGLACLDPAG